MFVQIMEQDPAAAGVVQELTFEITPKPLFYNAHVPTIWSGLQLTPNLTDLTLNLPATTPPSVFTGVHFARLHFLRTNLPHRVLVSFLSHHPTLSDLVMGPCGTSRACPLADVDLSHVTVLECSATCLAHVAHCDLNHLTVRRGSSRPSIDFASLPIAASLCSLTIDFFASDRDVLSGIALFAPFLRKLSLLERTCRSVSELGP